MPVHPLSRAPVDPAQRTLPHELRARRAPRTAARPRPTHPWSRCDLRPCVLIGYRNFVSPVLASEESRFGHSVQSSPGRSIFQACRGSVRYINPSDERAKTNAPPLRAEPFEAPLPGSEPRKYCRPHLDPTESSPPPPHPGPGRSRHLGRDRLRSRSRQGHSNSAPSTQPTPPRTADHSVEAALPRVDVRLAPRSRGQVASRRVDHNRPARPLLARPIETAAARARPELNVFVRLTLARQRPRPLPGEPDGAPMQVSALLHDEPLPPRSSGWVQMPSRIERQWCLRRGLPQRRVDPAQVARWLPSAGDKGRDAARSNRTNCRHAHLTHHSQPRPGLPGRPRRAQPLHLRSRWRPEVRTLSEHRYRPRPRSTERTAAAIGDPLESLAAPVPADEADVTGTTWTRSPGERSGGNAPDFRPTATTSSWSFAELDTPISFGDKSAPATSGTVARRPTTVGSASALTTLTLPLVDTLVVVRSPEETI